MSAGLHVLDHGTVSLSEFDAREHIWDFVVVENLGPEGLPLTSGRILSVDGKCITVSLGERPVASSGKAKARAKDWPSRVINMTNPDVKMTYLSLVQAVRVWRALRGVGKIPHSCEGLGAKSPIALRGRGKIPHSSEGWG